MRIATEPDGESGKQIIGDRNPATWSFHHAQRPRVVQPGEYFVGSTLSQTAGAPSTSRPRVIVPVREDRQGRLGVQVPAQRGCSSSRPAARQKPIHLREGQDFALAWHATHSFSSNIDSKPPHLPMSGATSGQPR